MVYFRIPRYSAAVILQRDLDEISRLTVDSLRPGQHLYLSFEEVHITPPVVSLLLEILNLPLFTVPNAEVKILKVTFYRCKLARPRTQRIPAEVTDCCSPDDLRILAETLAQRTSFLSFNDSPEILVSLLDVSKVVVEHLCLTVHQESLPALDCEQLVGSFLRWDHLKKLSLSGPYYLEDSQLFEALANAVHLQALSIREFPRYIFCRGDGTGVVGRLLQNSQSQLKELGLLSMDLKDRHFMAIVQMLPTSHLEKLNVGINRIGCQGILALAEQLPKIECLKIVSFGSNLWPSTEIEYEECWAALLHGLLMNYSIIHMYSDEESPIGCLVGLYCQLNLAGRRLIATASTVPLGLWPVIFERACSVRSPWCRPNFINDTIFYFLQNSPILSFMCSSSSLKNRPKKKSKIANE